VSTFVDTNILVYAFDNSEPAKRQTAITTLTDLADEIVVSTQVLTEFYWVTTRRLDPPLEHATASAAVDRLAEVPVVVTDAALVRRAITASDDHGVSLWDALIVEAAAAAGCDRVLTEDLNPGQLFGDIEVVNPFDP
jgi:predicted nucleic acid-binding protein